MFSGCGKKWTLQINHIGSWRQVWHAGNYQKVNLDVSRIEYQFFQINACFKLLIFVVWLHLTFQTLNSARSKFDIAMASFVRIANIWKLDFKTVLWIHSILMRIWIRMWTLDPHWKKMDPDPDPDPGHFFKIYWNCLTKQNFTPSIRILRTVLKLVFRFFIFFILHFLFHHNTSTC